VYDGRVGNAAKPGRLDGMRASYSCGASILNGSMIIGNILSHEVHCGVMC